MFKKLTYLLSTIITLSIALKIHAMDPIEDIFSQSSFTPGMIVVETQNVSTSSITLDFLNNFGDSVIACSMKIKDTTEQILLVEDAVLITSNLECSAAGARPCYKLQNSKLSRLSYIHHVSSMVLNYNGTVSILGFNNTVNSRGYEAPLACIAHVDLFKNTCNLFNLENSSAISIKYFRNRFYITGTEICKSQSPWKLMIFDENQIELKQQKLEQEVVSILEDCKSNLYLLTPPNQPYQGNNLLQINKDGVIVSTTIIPLSVRLRPKKNIPGIIYFAGGEPLNYTGGNKLTILKEGGIFSEPHNYGLKTISNAESVLYPEPALYIYGPLPIEGNPYAIVKIQKDGTTLKGPQTFGLNMTITSVGIDPESTLYICGKDNDIPGTGSCIWTVKNEQVVKLFSPTKGEQIISVRSLMHYKTLASLLGCYKDSLLSLGEVAPDVVAMKILTPLCNELDQYAPFCLSPDESLAFYEFFSLIPKSCFAEEHVFKPLTNLNDLYARELYGKALGMWGINKTSGLSW